MGELICLKEYREKLLLKEIDELKAKLQKIIVENNLYVENSPYYDYNQIEYDNYSYLTSFSVTEPDFYY